MSEEQKFVWISKYALTKGVYKLPLGKIVDSKMAVCPSTDSYRMNEFFHGLDWHLDEQSAKEHASGMVKRKIASLEKQIQKLKVLTF